MGQALYRKYRSRSLDEIVGQEHITKTLASAIKSGRISHAYLFTGPRGVGKTSIARILAREINQLPYSDDTQLDIIEIDAASNRRIDDIRDLRDKVHIAPVSARYKVYIIDEVHMLTGESFNALLKTLEEPPEHVIFVLATTEVHKLPATIVSRTQRYSFRPIDATKVVKHLADIAKKEKIIIDDDALALVAAHGEGSFRDSISLLDQLSNVSEGTITAETVEEMLGLAPQTSIEELLLVATKGDHKAIASKLEELETRGVSAAAVVNQLIAYLRGAASDNPKLFLLIDKLLDVPKAHNPQLKLLTTLVEFSLNQNETLQHKAIHIATKPVFEATVEKPKKTQEHKTTAPEGTSGKTEKDEATSNTDRSEVDHFTPEQWSKVVAELRRKNPPLYSVASRAAMSFDATTKILTLSFRFKLHQKKLESAAHKAKLMAIIAELCGGCPQIMLTLDPNAQPIQNDPAPPTEVDDTSKSVLDIMGGGEIMPNAETT